MTIQNIQKTIKAFVKAESAKSAAILAALQDYMGTDKAFKDDSQKAFSHMVDVIKSTAKDASEDNAIPATIKQYCTHLVGVANDANHGIEWIIRQGTFGAIRKAYTNIQEIKRGDEKPKDGDAKSKADKAPTVKLDPIIQALAQFRNQLKERGETKALQNFDYMLTTTLQDHVKGNKPTQEPKAAVASIKVPKAKAKAQQAAMI